jgi:endoglucanase
MTTWTVVRQFLPGPGRRGALGAAVLAAAVLVVLISPSNAPASAAAVHTLVPGAPTDRVLAGEELSSGQEIVTATGSHRLAMQADGNLVLYAGAVTVWSTGTAGNPGARLRMAAAGDLAVTSGTGATLWTNGVSSPGARLVIKPDGRVYEVAKAGNAVWRTPPPRVVVRSYLADASPYVLPDSPAAIGARRALLAGRMGDAALLEKAAAQGSTRWLTTSDPPAAVEGTVRALAAAAQKAGQTPVFVAYAIPNRDCGSLSSGGFTAQVYRDWSAAVARGLVGFRAVVLVEPDSLMNIYKCPAPLERFALLKQVSAGYAAAGAEVYLDAGTGNTFGRSATTLADIAARLKTAGVDQVAGFATNVANFQTTAEESVYGHTLSAMLGGASFVIDTSRNGNGALRDATGVVWCNPPGRALGDRPGATVDGPHVANLWVKTVGRSDGTCNGGPTAGTYWEAYLLGLAANAHW